MKKAKLILLDRYPKAELRTMYKKGLRTIRLPLVHLDNGNIVIEGQYVFTIIELLNE